MRDEFFAICESMGSTKDIVLRELVRAFNAAGAGGVRLAFPLAIMSPSYRIHAGRVIDARNWELNEAPGATSAEAPARPEPKREQISVTLTRLGKEALARKTRAAADAKAHAPKAQRSSGVSGR